MVARNALPGRERIGEETRWLRILGCRWPDSADELAVPDHAATDEVHSRGTAAPETGGCGPRKRL